MSIKRIVTKVLIVLNLVIILNIIPNLNILGNFGFPSDNNRAGVINAFDGYNSEFVSNNANTSSTSEINSQNMFILRAANHFDPNPAKGGGDINIVDNSALASESGVLGTSSDIAKNNNKGSISLYEVKEGDTLSQIADMFDVSTNTIRWANDFEGPIRPGQSLVILPVNGLTHTIKNGGTIADVAEVYDADVKEIALFNGLDTDVQLEPGDEIIVPNVDAIKTPAASDSSTNSPTPTRSYAQSTNSETSGSANTGGGFINPVPGAIITQALHGYNAIDIAASYGTPILASGSGRVIISREGGWNGGYGNYVVISHENGVETLYSHNSSNTVYEGQYVEQGEVIGYMGSTGRSTGNHLHFETRGATNPIASCAVGSTCR